MRFLAQFMHLVAFAAYSRKPPREFAPVTMVREMLRDCHGNAYMRWVYAELRCDKPMHEGEANL